MSRGASTRKTETSRRFPLRYLAFALVGVALAVASVWAVNAVSRLKSMHFDHLVVRGQLRHTDPAAVRDAALPYLSANFVSVDLEGLRKAVEKLPWVARAQLRREWPGTLYVRVREEVPVAIWNGKGLMNGYGKVFADSVGDYAGRLPLLNGPDGTQALLLQAYTSMQPPVAQRGEQLVALSLSERRAWTLGLDDGVEVRLGRENAEHRLDEFSRVALPALKQRWGDVAYVDMRYTNGFAVGWKHATTGA